MPESAPAAPLRDLEGRIALVQKALDARLPRAELAPAALHEAMRYSVLGGGKRLRPLLCLLACEACGGSAEAALAPACALEFVHAYSLIHDDLPAMDDDDLRRGRLTCHKAYGEATAILAGDALLTLAFETIAEEVAPAVVAPMVLRLARAAGSVGMVGGQVLDLEGEGQAPDLETVERIDRWKTGALLAGAAVLGGLAAGATPAQLAALEAYGAPLGAAFQIADDLLDITSTTTRLGKKTGKDAKRRKQTVPAILGVREARLLAGRAAAEAQRALEPLGSRAEPLRRLAAHMAERTD